MKRESLKTHWTWKTFVEHGEFFLKLLDKRFQETDLEVEAISKILAEHHIPTGSKVLDVYCLAGKHAIALAERGYDVVGVDISPLMIRHANETAKTQKVQDRVRFLVGDPRHILQILRDEEEEFKAILTMYTHTGSYGEKTDQELLKQLLRLAAPRGLITVEVSNRDYVVRHLQKASIYSIDDLEYHVERQFNIETSSMENILKYYTKKGNDLRCNATIEVEHRVYSLHELISLFNRTGWNYVKAYGDFALEQPTVDSPSLIVVGQKTAPHRQLLK